MARKNTEEETDQFLLRPPVSLIERVRAEAQTYGFTSGPQAAIDIIEEFIDDWVELQKQLKQVREERRARGKAPAALTQKERRKAS